MMEEEGKGSPTKHDEPPGDWRAGADLDGPIDANYPNMRRFRASRNFKNPPQPHMCIREKTIDGQELFINVLSWTRIANPNDKNSPIPLFGGMRVPPGSPRSPPLVFAVMASPEVLKAAGRKCPETPERMNLIDLMCEFVEEMNPGLILSRKPEILKDRDLSGELKDVWSAVQALRERQRTPKAATQENLVLYTEFGPPVESAPSYEQAAAFAAQQRETVIQYSNPTTTPPPPPIEPNAAAVDQIDSINLETENMRISPPAAAPVVEEPNATSVIVTNKSATTTATPNSPVATTKKEKDNTNHSHLFFPKFRSKNHQITTTTVTTTDENADVAIEKQKKGLNFFRRKLSPKNEKPDTDNNKEILTPTPTTTLPSSPVATIKDNANNSGEIVK